jgi:hypothetical protein
MKSAADERGLTQMIFIVLIGVHPRLSAAKTSYRGSNRLGILEPGVLIPK